MKRFLCVCICIFILTISIITYFPVMSYAADDFTLSTSNCNIPEAEANNAINNKGNIYNSDHTILFYYTPTSSYNWTMGDNNNIHLSDAQAKAIMRSNNKTDLVATLIGGGASNHPVTRALLSALGVLTTGNSDIYTSFLDSLTSNYNYLNSIEYDPQTGDLTFLADQVAALRNELKERYYNLIGLQVYESRSLSDFVGSSTFRDMFEDISDYTDTVSRVSDYKTALVFGANTICRVIFLKDKISNGYLFNDSTPKTYYHSDRYYSYYPIIGYSNDVSSTLQIDTSECIDVQNYKYDSFTPLSDIEFLSDSSFLHSNPLPRFDVDSNFLHVYSDYDTYIFKSYEALYNFLHGSQNAFLSSKINGVGEDIKLSINDMSDNIGSKIDDLIDSINNKKEGMSADELQKAIDNALDSLSKKVDDIGDNTAETNNKLDSLLSLMSEQNNILLQILGVTEYIAYNTTKEDGSDYTTDDLKNTFNTMYDGVRNAILYGTNTVSDSGSTVSVAAYSSEDLATQDINNLDVHNGLFGKFPFSIPYQLYEWLQVLEAEPAAPTFNYNYGFMIFKKDDPDCNLTIDLSVYEPWANQAKSFERLFFTLLMAVFIYKKFKGNSLF